MIISNKELLDNNYLIVDNFIDAEYAKALYKTFREDSLRYPENFQKDPQCPNSLAMCNWRWFLELLIVKTPFMSEIIGEPMLPTYSYARVYCNQETLKKHKDRPACEISVSVHLDGDNKWPICFTKPNGEEVSVELSSGQAVIYLGCDSIHWRDAYEGEHYGQVFLHYVKSRGNNWVYYFDNKGVENAN